MKGSSISTVSFTKQETFLLTITMFIIVLLALSACNSKKSSIQVEEDDIGGVVMGPSGPEAGVWVIAETHDLPTRFAKIVVTDENGQYLIPDLPLAN
jgi:hypothetical protein